MDFLSHPGTHDGFLFCLISVRFTSCFSHNFSCPGYFQIPNSLYYKKYMYVLSLMSSIEYVKQIPYIFQWRQENIQVSPRRKNQKKCSTRLRPQLTVLGLVKHGRTKRPPWLSLIKMELSFAFILCGYHG